MSTGNITLAGNVSNAPTGARSFGPLTVTAPSAVDQTLVVSLASGDNTITVPAGTTAVVITGPNATNPQPNPPSGATLKLKGNAGDTGVAISNKFPTLLSWDTAPASFILNSSTTATVEIWMM